MKGAAALNESLIGVSGGRTILETPALVVDGDAIDANIASLSQMIRKSGLGLRPHAKTHKCAAIARKQLAAGALGIACAKSGELLALFDAGITSLMLTAPVSSLRKVERLAHAAARGADLIVVADRLDLVSAYGAAARKAGATLSVLVDCDPGLGRTGATTSEAVVAIARAIASEQNLTYAGIQAYSGQVQHIHDFVARRRANQEANTRIKVMIDALKANGLAPKIVSGGGTGSHQLDFEDQVLTEVQAGSYVFMDEGYLPVNFHGTTDRVFAVSLFVAVTVIGHSHNGEAVTDGGTKSFAIDGPPPTAFLNGQKIGTIAWAGDEFGRIKTLPGVPAPPAGSRIECTVPHCDPTVNLHDFIHVVRGDRLTEIWPVEGRGLSD